MTANRKAVLLVDDEARSLKYFRRAFADRFPIFAASSAAEALQVLARHHEEIGVIVTDQRMPESTGVELLRTVRREYPRTVRILTTAYTELDLLIEAINSGAVYSFVSKPWQLDDLERTLVSALEHYETDVRNHRLLEQRLDEFTAKLLDGHTHDIALIAAKIGHYVHNALCPVTVVIDQLLEGRGAELSPEFLVEVREHVGEVARMLKDLAQISVPPQQKDFEPVDAAAVFAAALDATESLRAQKHIEIRADIPGDLPPIRGVPSQIEKLFRFMIAEEIVSLPAGSVVEVRARPQSADGQETGLRIEFEDFEPLPAGTTGDTLLQPFNLRSANPREFGIFLASCYFIAMHHEGSLSARVKENQSLVFTFFLPYAKVDALFTKKTE
jgi:CheY-like chemotaxis protein